MSNTVTISDQTYNVLKNYCGINSSILIREGSVLKTISVGENAIAEYICEETFPKTFGIYDLNQFLAGLSILKDSKDNNPVLEFGNDSYVTIKGNGRSIKYYFSSPEITLKSAPEKEIQFPDSDVEFTITESRLKSIHQIAGVYGLPDLAFISKDGQVSLKVCDREDETSNVYDLSVVGTATGDFEFFMKIDNIRVMDASYKVNISSKLITRWQHQNIDLKYYIALEP